MILDLRDTDTFPVRRRVVAEPGSFVLDYEGVRQVKHVAADLVVQQAGEELYCQGTVEATVRLECSRCLEDYDTELTGECDFFVCSARPDSGDDRPVIDDEDYAFFTGDSQQADISDLVRQAMILAIGLKPVCGDECRGLCSKCGSNLNRTECDCQSQRTDPRWDALKKLKENRAE